MRVPAAPKTVARMTLGRELRRHREDSGVDTTAVLERLGWDATKLSRIESGSGTVAPAEIDALADLFGVTGDAATRLKALGADARKRTTYGKTADWARTYVEWEQGATGIQFYEAELVPGLFQTPDYTRAVVLGSVVSGQADADQIVNDRGERQRVLHRESAPAVEVVLGEGVLRRVVGGPDVMREQLSRLLEVMDVPGVTLQVLPFSSGAHAALGSTFIILTLEDLTAVYLEDLTSADYLDRPYHVNAYTTAFNRLQVAALGPLESRHMIRDVRDGT